MRKVSSRGGGAVVFFIIAGTLLWGFTQGVLGSCGPFTDVAADVFCPFVLEIFYLGITTGTTATTYNPTGNVTRLQMAAFLSRSVDGVLKRNGRRVAMKRFWTPGTTAAVALTDLGGSGQPSIAQSDGTDAWVS